MSDYSIPDDPKFGVTVRKQLETILEAWNAGDFKAAGRGIDALKNFLWPWFTKKARDKFDSVKFKTTTLEELHTEEDRQCLEDYGELPKKRIDALKKQRNRTNKLRYYKCRQTEIRYLMFACKDMSLGFKQDGVLYDPFILQSRDSKDSGEAMEKEPEQPDNDSG